MKTDLLATPAPVARTAATARGGALPEAERRKLARAFWAAVAVSVALAFVPQGRMILYPFALLATWAHEMGHGLTALLSGGSFDYLVLFPNLGGTAYSRTAAGSLVAPALVSAGGLVGPAVAGGLTIVFGARPRLARMVLYLFAGMLLASLVVWVRNPFGMAAVAGLGLGFGVLARYGGDALKLGVAQLTGIQLCLGSVSTFDYMFTRDFVRDGQVQISDTQAIAQSLFLPYWFWGGLIAGVSLLILAASFWFAWVRPALQARRAARAA